MVKIVKWSLVLVLIVLLSAAAFEAFASGTRRETGSARIAPHHERISPERGTRELARIIGILEHKIGNRRLPDQTKEKLATLDAQEFLLVTKLCDRIAEAGDKPGTDIALLLAAALIVLS